MLLAATAVIQFCAQAFSLYAYQTAIYEIFTDQVQLPACANIASLVFCCVCIRIVVEREQHAHTLHSAGTMLLLHADTG